MKKRKQIKMRKKQVFSINRLFIVVFLFIVLIIAIVLVIKNYRTSLQVKAAEPELIFTSLYKYSGAVIKRDNTYDNGASVIKDGNYYHVWYCGNKLGGHNDVILYAKLDNKGKIVTSPRVVLEPTNSLLAEDGYHACSPTVIKHANPDMFGGKEVYKMYYECAAKHYNQNGVVDSYFTQTCHASSEDGINWKKWNSNLWDTQGQYGTNTTEPTAILKITDLIRQNCQLRIENGRYVVNAGLSEIDCSNRAINYGSGHPTAIVRPLGVGGQQQIWLFYYDSGGEWNSRAVWVTHSWDGLHFEAPQKTNLQNVPDIKLFTPNTLASDVVFMAVGNWFRGNQFGYSYDALHWIYPTDSSIAGFDLGKVTDSLLPVGGHPSLAGDKYGVIDSRMVSLFSAEGTPSDPLTWDLYLMHGVFSLKNMQYGLTGSYYDNKDFTNLKGVLQGDTITYDWGNRGPYMQGVQLGAETFSVRWAGVIEAPYTTQYTFYTTSNDGVKVWVDNKLVISNWAVKPPANKSGKITLNKGRYSIKVDYFEETGSAKVSLDWSTVFFPRSTVPLYFLFDH